MVYGTRWNHDADFLRQHVGAVVVPLPIAVRMSSFLSGDRPEMDTVIFTQTHYVPALKQYFETIEIDIGKVISKLHFPQQRPDFN